MLVVDDDDDIRNLVREYLDLSGLEVVGGAVDGVQAVEEAERLQPDVVVLDWQMPRLAGIDALPKILEVAPDAVVVMFSSVLSPEAERAALAAGAAAFVEKVTPLRELVTIVVSSHEQRSN